MTTISPDRAEAIRRADVTDRDVVRRVVGGDRAIFEVLMRRHNQRVYRAIRSVLRDDAEVEDAMQQTYLLAYAHLAEFAGSSSFATWLTRIAMNEAMGRIRRRRHPAAVPRSASPEDTGSAEDHVASTADTPEEQTATREAALLLEREIDRLPEAYRSVLVLRDVEQLSTAEVADVLKLSEEAVRIRLHRARRSLREAFAAQVGRGAAHVFPFFAPRCDRVVSGVMAELDRR